MFRDAGELVAAELPALWADDTAHLIGELLIESGFGDQFEHFLTEHTEIDCGLSLDGTGRVRANIYLAQRAVAGAFRLVRGYVPTVGELGLPEVALALVQRPAGLLIITGPTGHGKTTSQAALLQALAQRVRRHILTIEDPIEYALVAGQSLVSQREVGSDTASFAAGLRAALREDPNVLLVGEMRDLDTISTALTAAETGHLVLTTLHTHDAVSAVDRIVDVFPSSQQFQVRTQLAEVLLGVLAQRLLPARRNASEPRRELAGRVLACEVLIGPMGDVHAVRGAIRDNKTAGLYSIMETHREQGMQTMEAAVAPLVREGEITEAVAFATTVRQETLRQLLGR